MLRLPHFAFHEPTKLDAALALLHELAESGSASEPASGSGAESAPARNGGSTSAERRPVRLLAGGTDLVPNMKHEVTTPSAVISLQRLPELRGVQIVSAPDAAGGGSASIGSNASDGAGADQEQPWIRLGAMTTLQTLCEDQVVAQALPALAEACRAIAGPQHRRMGTLGGNVCLDTRCPYINQTYFWREALGFCLKRDGTVCHVVEKGRRCVAASSNDSALPLMLHNAELEIARHGAPTRRLPLRKFFAADGVYNKSLDKSEMVTAVWVPQPAASGFGVAFEKLRMRRSIDFPLVHVAASVRLESGEGAKATSTTHSTPSKPLVSQAEVIVGALGPRPKVINLSAALAGKPLDDEALRLASRKAVGACKPLTNIATCPEWRREMVGVLVCRALQSALRRASS